MSLKSFYFPAPSAFLVPVEHLGPKGIDDSYWGLLQAEHGLEEAWRAQFDKAYATYWERSTRLFHGAPRHWLPPRPCNLVVVREPEACHPYQRPLFNSASLVYASDFDPGTSSVETGAFLLMHLERLQVRENLGEALLSNLSAFLLLDDAQAKDFQAGAKRSVRPDRSGFQALATALPWLRSLHHVSLRPPQGSAQLGELGQTGLLVPAARQSDLGPLVEAFAGGAHKAVETHYDYFAQGDESASLLAWLSESAPRVVIVDPKGQALWDPDRPAETERLQAVLPPLHGQVVAAIRADLEVIDARSQAFLSALRDPSALPLPTSDVVDQSDGIYLQEGRHLLAYSLAQPAWEPIREPTPPFVRLLVAARTIHEWGHLGEESGLVRPTSEAALRKAHQGLEQAFSTLLQVVPPNFQELVLRESAGQDSPAKFALERTLARVPDYLANLLANHFLQPAELEAYVRLNVRSHVGEPLGPIGQLAHHALEFQYMRFSQLDSEAGRDYALRITAAHESLVGSGFTTQTQLEAVLEAASKVCDVYEVDASAFVSLPKPCV